MPVQVRNLNLNLIKWTQTRVSSFVTHLDHRTTNTPDEKVVRGHCTALSVKTDDHFGQMSPATQPLVELLNCSPVQTQTTAQPNCDPRHLLDPCWGHGSLSTPSLPLPPVLNPRSIRSSPVYSSVHIPDFNCSLAKLVNSTSHNVFIATDAVDSVADFSLSPLRDETKSLFPVWGNGPGIAADSVVEVLDPACTKIRSLRSTWSWSDSGPKSQSLIYSCEKPKSSELTCSSSTGPGGSPTPEAKGNGPSGEQLLQMKEKLIQAVPVFFKRTHDYRMYHPNLVFINNFWGKEEIHKGLAYYMLELGKARILSHLKYAHLQMNIVKITMHPEDGSIKIHWRVSGLPQLKTLQFWKFLPWTYRKSLKTESKFFDGFSTLFIGCDELIYKHRVDRLMTDEEPMREKSPDLALKLGLLFGLLPRTGF